MIEASFDFLLPVPPEQAFDYLAEPANDPAWQAACQSAELLDSPCRVGSRYRIVFSLLGRNMQFQCEVTERERASVHAFRAVEGSFTYRGRYRFEAHAQGTRVHWHFAAEPGSFFGLLPASLLRKVLLSQIERDTEALARRWATPLPG
jgi:carbon monoxide dehydrogenase subunit G